MKMIKWGVLGTAYIFERDTAEGMRQAENCELYAIAGRSMEKAQAFKEKYGFRKAYGSYDELLRAHAQHPAQGVDYQGPERQEARSVRKAHGPQRGRSC